MTLMTCHDAYEPASKHTVYQRCLGTCAILCGRKKTETEFQIILALDNLVKILVTSWIKRIARVEWAKEWVQQTHSTFPDYFQKSTQETRESSFTFNLRSFVVVQGLSVSSARNTKRFQHSQLDSLMRKQIRYLTTTCILMICMICLTKYLRKKSSVDKSELNIYDSVF